MPDNQLAPVQLAILLAMALILGCGLAAIMLEVAGG